MKRLSVYLLATLLISALITANAFALTFYVDASRGHDRPFWGRSAFKPFKTINYAISKSCKIPDIISSETTIKVAQGTYDETLSIECDSISIEGAGNETTIIDADGSDIAVITINGAHRVTIKDLTVRRGYDGILATKGSAVVLDGVNVEDNTTDGIQIDDGSNAQLSNCTTQRNGRRGIFVYNSSSATFKNKIISSKNTFNGIDIQGNSNVFINAVVESNQNYAQGLQIVTNSSALIYNGTVSTNDNNSWGILISQSSHLATNNNSTISSSGNSIDGILISYGSGLSVNGGTQAFFENNDRHGVIVDSGNISTYNNGVLIIRNNPSIGLNVYHGGVIDMWSGGSTIVDNGTDFSLRSMSQAFFNGNNIGTITCDGTVLIEGDEICP